MLFLLFAFLFFCSSDSFGFVFVFYLQFVCFYYWKSIFLFFILLVHHRCGVYDPAIHLLLLFSSLLFVILFSIAICNYCLVERMWVGNYTYSIHRTANIKWSAKRKTDHLNKFETQTLTLLLSTSNKC